MDTFYCSSFDYMRILVKFEWTVSQEHSGDMETANDLIKGVEKKDVQKAAKAIANDADVNVVAKQILAVALF